MDLVFSFFLTEHVEEALRIHQQCLPMPWSEKLFQEALKDKNNIGFSALIEDDLSGFIIGRKIQEEAEILTLVVDESQQGRGVGTKLLHHFLAHLKQQHIKKIFLEVKASNTPAMKLYESFGFRKIGRRENYYTELKGHSRTAEVLEKSFF